jgi:hypothetical protein
MTPKQKYEAGVLALGGKGKASRLHPWEFSRLKREYAPFLHGGARMAVIASAMVMESQARARNIPEPVDNPDE